MLHIFSKQGLLSTAFGVVRWCVASLEKQTHEWGGRFKQQMEQQNFGWKLFWVGRDFCGRGWLRAKFLFAAWFKIWISNLRVEIQKSKPSGGLMGGKPYFGLHVLQVAMRSQLIGECLIEMSVNWGLGSCSIKALAVKMTSSGGMLISGVWKKTQPIGSMGLV